VKNTQLIKRKQGVMFSAWKYEGKEAKVYGKHAKGRMQAGVKKLSLEVRGEGS